MCAILPTLRIIFSSLGMYSLLSETRSERCNTCPFVGCAVQNEHKQLPRRVTAIKKTNGNQNFPPVEQSY